MNCPLPLRAVAAAAALASCPACSPSLPPIVVRAHDLTGRADTVQPGQPLIVEFDEGDVIPFSLHVDGDLAETPKDAAPVPIRIKRRFFLRIDRSGMRVSRDGVHFGEHRAPGTFNFGIHVDRDGTRATLAIVTPSP